MHILILNQAFYPDVASTAQHASDLARALVQRGHRVTVVCSRRAYDDPEIRFPRDEVWQGIRIRRVSGAGFGKSTRLSRAVDFGTVMAAMFCRVLLLDRVDLTVAMTSPPLLSLIAALFSRLRHSKLVLWIMDLNPDQAIAAGWLHAGSLGARLLNALLSYSLSCAGGIVVLDRFMRDRLIRKGVPQERISVIAPWSHDEAVAFDPAGRDRFRAAHNLTGRFVVMYSGNHSPCHPLHTVLEAARSLSAREDIVFCFIGGGSQWARVKEFASTHSLRNVLCLPYQPIETLRDSLSAADLHVVVMGDPFVGIIHPCKVYNIVTLGTPFLYIGPPQSHIEDLIADGRLQHASYRVRHGDLQAAIAGILSAAADPKHEDPALLRTSARFSQRLLASQMADLLESVAAAPGAVPPRAPEELPALDR